MNGEPRGDGSSRGKEERKTDLKRVVYTCPYIPAEWIRAHGVRPDRILPSGGFPETAGELQEGICHYAREMLDRAVHDPGADGVVISTVCDHMRRLPDLLQVHTDTPVFLFNVPATWQTVGAHRLYISELKRLGTFLITLGGASPSAPELIEWMTRYDSQRAVLREAAGFLSGKQFSEAIVRFHESGFLPGRSPDNPVQPGVPVALVGGPLSRQDFQLFDLVQSAGGAVVLDGTETGERTLPRPFNPRARCEDPLAELADAYFGTIPDAFRRPNSELYIWLKNEIRQRGAAGVVFVRNVWCDLWHGEMERMRDWLSLPMLTIDLDGDEPGPREKTRIEAFLETLR